MLLGLILLFLHLKIGVSASAGCCSNFKNLDSLHLGQDEVFRGYQILYPSINFTCNNSHISKFIFSGRINNLITASTSKIQLWQRDELASYTLQKSWNISKNDVTVRNDNLLELALEANVKADTVIGIFLPWQTKEVDIHFRRSSSTDLLYYRTAFVSPSTTLNIKQMTIGDEVFPKMTVEISNILCNTIPTVTYTSSIVSIPTESTDVIKSTMSFTTATPTVTSSDGATSLESSIKSIMAESSISSVNMASKESIVAASMSKESASTESHTPSIITIATQSVTYKDLTTLASVSSNIMQLSSQTTTSATGDNTPRITSTTIPVPTANGPPEASEFSGYLIATIVTSSGFVILCLILVGIALYLACRSIRKRKGSHPVEANEPSFAAQRPQSSLYSNHAYMLNKFKKESNSCSVRENVSSPIHHYDKPSFTASMEPQAIENRYSTLNRLTQFSHNPAYAYPTANHTSVDTHHYDEPMPKTIGYTKNI